MMPSLPIKLLKNREIKLLKDGPVIEVAEHYFQRVIEIGFKRVLNTDLHSYVCQVTGQDREAVHGTLDSTGKGSLYAADWYQAGWHKKTLENGHVVHVRGPTPKKEKENTPHLDYIIRVLNIDPDALVITADIDNAYLSHRHSNIKSIGVYEAPSEPCKLFNANTAGGYASKKLIKFLQKIDSEREAEILVLTVMKLDNFRNTGPFQDRLRHDYIWSDDKHAQCISDQLEGYEMIDRFVFRRRPKGVQLETFVFVREE
jgi:hypothetical protein